MIYKKLPHIKYDINQLRIMAERLKYSDGYAELGRTIPQEVCSLYDFNNPYIEQILNQFLFPKIFYCCSFVRTQAHKIVAPHDDSASNNIIRTVNVLFPLLNYNTPLEFYKNKEKIDSVMIDCPIAFDCTTYHGYRNDTDGWRSAFLLQCKMPYTFNKLIQIGAL
jgi:hypothetical protein